MTTDITELVQREKFEAWWERTQNNGNPPRFGWSHWRDGEGYKVDDDDSELEGMWSAWKAAGAEMRERMLAAEARVVELESRTTNDRIVAESEARGVEKAIAHLEKKFSNIGVQIMNLQWLADSLREGADK